MEEHTAKLTQETSVNKKAPASPRQQGLFDYVKDFKPNQSLALVQQSLAAIKNDYLKVIICVSLAP